MTTMLGNDGDFGFDFRRPNGSSREPPRADANLVEALDLAIESGRSSLASEQREDGSWEGHTDLGPVGAAMNWIVERQFDMLTTEEAAEAARHLLSQQRPDGSYPAFPGAKHGSASATALCRAGLIACGVSPSHPALRQAMTFVDAHGGHDAIAAGLSSKGDVTGLYLVAMDLVDPRFLPALPKGLALTPFDRLVDRRVHAGNIMVTLVLCAMANRYARAVPSGLIGSAARAAENFRIRSYLFEWQNGSGDWNGQAIQTWLMLLGLAATGLGKTDPRIARAFGWLRGLRQVDDNGLGVGAMRTDVWSTAWASLALHAAGEASDGAALTAAERHLLAAQCKRPMPRVNQRKSGAARTGGWPFQRGNDTMPDSDDTGVVLAALGVINGGRATREVFQATEAAVRWLRDMQNPEGGFPAFVWNLPPKQPGPMYLVDIPLVLDSPARALAFLLNPPAEFSDPAAEGITGRVLWGLGASGVGRDDPAVCRAIDFLRAQQCKNGAWWGRWMTCYLAETATTLVGLAAVGEDMRESYVDKALHFLLEHQNPDGGFGELAGAYRDPESAGWGPSMPPVTGFVLLGLLAVGTAPRDALERAARYLIENQEADGRWSNAEWLHTVNPPDSFYTYDVPARALPLLALCRYRALLKQAGAEQ
jgi:squalene cyclase